MAIFSGELPPQALLYHYTSPTTLPKILGSKLIRLSPLADMADARESRKWNPSVRDDVNSGVTNTEYQSWCREIDEALRQRAKVACFTGDRLPTGPAGSADEFHRGYARARMWDQYACHHTGVCLIFDEIELVEQATRTLGVHSEVQFNRVSYVDRRVGDAYGSLSFNVSDLRRGVADAAKQYLSSNWKELLLTKNLDWASEEERRILFIEPDSVATIREFPFGSALVAVVLGESLEHDVQAKAVSLAKAAGLPSEKSRTVQMVRREPASAPAQLGEHTEHVRSDARLRWLGGRAARWVEVAPTGDRGRVVISVAGHHVGDIVGGPALFS